MCTDARLGTVVGLKTDLSSFIIAIRMAECDLKHYVLTSPWSTQGMFCVNILDRICQCSNLRPGACHSCMHVNSSKFPNLFPVITTDI